MDLPLITEATSDYYRSIYADPDLGPIFKGVNMVVLRTHVSYFIHQLTMFDTPLTQRQIEYLKKVHIPIIQEHNVHQRHYDIMVAYLTEAMRANGAQESHLEQVLTKLAPLRDLFPTHNSSSVDGTVVLQENQQPPKADSGDSTSCVTQQPLEAAAVTASSGCPCGLLQSSGASNSGKGQSSSPHHDQEPMVQPNKHTSWVRRLTSCMCSS